MAGEPGMKEPRDIGRILVALVVAGIVVLAGAVVYIAYSISKKGGSEPYSIVSGDSVTMNYIGRFPDGRVFDTSLLSVAQDDANYPKSLTFSLRSNESYKPFEMEAGLYGSGGTIKGFAMGVIGLHVGDYKMIEIAPEDAYPMDPNMLRTINLTQTVPVKELYTLASFKSSFNTDPIPLATLAHFFWKWKVQVASVEGDTVTVLNQPTEGSTVYPFGDPNATTPYGWEVRILSYDPAADGGNGIITVQNMVSKDDVYNVRGTDSGGGEFIVAGYDEANGTFQLHVSNQSAGYNGEIAGRALIFEVTILSVVPAES
jgi:FKBP-type peptidyl-prolyl cis-trans isomerase 2